ncbi:MAG: hypothetical protein J6C91_02365, partial [Muribaculaceae bacterium]|nr:hypothetical protein [Muribaculaceae bacterium]
ELNVDFTPISDVILGTYAETRSGDYDVRYQIEIYATSGPDAGNLIERKVWTSDVISEGATIVTTDVGLHAEKYDIYAWIDFVPKGTSEDHHYITSDLRKVTIADPNVRGIDSRDAFSGKTSADLTSYRHETVVDISIPVEMERPFGKFKIITTDVRRFLDTYKPQGTYADIVPAQTLCRYTSYFPTSYNLDTRLADVDGFKLGVVHPAEVTEEEDNSAVLTCNYVLVCNDNTMVSAEIEVWNKDGEKLVTTRNIMIPIQRNKLTIVSGEFLTKDLGTGGVGVNDSFEDEFVIII